MSLREGGGLIAETLWRQGRSDWSSKLQVSRVHRRLWLDLKSKIPTRMLKRESVQAK